MVLDLDVDGRDESEGYRVQLDLGWYCDWVLPYQTLRRLLQGQLDRPRHFPGTRSYKWGYSYKSRPPILGLQFSGYGVRDAWLIESSLSMTMSACVRVSVSVCASDRAVRLYVCISACLFICLPVCFACLSVYICMCLFCLSRLPRFWDGVVGSPWNIIWWNVQEFEIILNNNFYFGYNTLNYMLHASNCWPFRTNDPQFTKRIDASELTHQWWFYLGRSLRHFHGFLYRGLSRQLVYGIWSTDSWSTMTFLAEIEPGKMKRMMKYTIST